MSMSPKVLFFGRPYTVFSDNSKYAFLSYLRQGKNGNALYLTQNQKEHDLMNNAGLPVVLYNKASPLHRLLEEDDVIVSDCHDWKFEENFWTAARRNRFINLWHGAPIKNLGMRVPKYSPNQSFKSAMVWPHAFTNLHAFVSTSKYLNETAWHECFHSKNYPVLGYSRNDILFREAKPFELLNTDQSIFERLQAEKDAGVKLVIYSPTFRDNGENNLDRLDIDITKLDSFCRTNGILFCLKVHPLLKIEQRVRDCTNIVEIDGKSDIYPLLPMFDMMVTDYSSIFLDFLLLDRPVTFHCPDLASYKADDRGMCLNYDDIAAGRRTTSFAELLSALDEFAKGTEDEYAAEREAVKNLVHDHKDGLSGDRLVSYLDTELAA